ncbi:MAG: CotH kinase family protein [Lachnospiraceae bacterium]|nr:CotH kinase family protein [Lachnospiraceae bacterium]
MKKSDARGIVLLILAALFVAGVFIYTRKLWKENYDPYAGVTTYFDELVFCATGSNASADVYCYTDKENDYLNHWIFLPSFADLNRTTIEFKESEYLSVIDESGEGFIIGYGQPMKGLSLDKRYEVSFHDAEGNVLETGGLTVKQAEGISSVFVKTVSENLKAVHEDKDYRAPGEVLIVNAEGHQEVNETLKGFKGHGNTTWQRDKKPYQIKLKKNRNLFGMGSAKNWILLANAMDISEIRNSVAYELARRAGMYDVTDLEWVELYIDGAYRGLYQLSEKVEIGKNRVDITDLENLNGIANVGSPEPMQEKKEEISDTAERVSFEFDGEPSDITGGYLVEHNYDSKYESRTARFITEAGEKYILRSPAYASADEVNYIADLFGEIDVRAEKNDNSIEEIIDLESFAMKYAFEELVKNDGAGVTSSYFYKDRDSIDPLIYAGPVWDYDKALGNASDIKNNAADTLCFNTAHRENTTLFWKLYMNNEAFLDMVKKGYTERFRDSIPAITADGGYIDALKLEIAADNGMDDIRWNLSREEREEDIEEVRRFLTERKVFLDKVWGENAELCIAHERNGKSIGDVYVGYLKGSRLGSSFASESNYVNEETGEKVDENTVINEDIIVVKK